MFYSVLLHQRLKHFSSSIHLPFRPSPYHPFFIPSLGSPFSPIRAWSLTLTQVQVCIRQSSAAEVEEKRTHFMI